MVTIDWGATNTIYIPQSFLTLVSGTLYELDTEALRLALKALEASEEGEPFPDTHARNAPYTIVGTTYAQSLEIIPPYSVLFEAGTYSVKLSGSNNNIFDVESGILQQNTVQVISNNSAGLIVVTNTPVSPDVNVVSVNAVPVTSPNDFKADIAPLL